jgi:hypothetical protein
VFSSSLSAQYTGKQTGTATTFLKAYTLYDLTAAWNVNEVLTLRGGVSNLADKKLYAEGSTDYFVAGRSYFLSMTALLTGVRRDRAGDGPARSAVLRVTRFPARRRRACVAAVRARSIATASCWRASSCCACTTSGVGRSTGPGAFSGVAGVVMQPPWTSRRRTDSAGAAAELRTLS